MADDTQLNIRLQAIDNLSPTMNKAISSIQQLTSAVNQMTPSVQHGSESHDGLNSELINLVATGEIWKMGLEALKIGYELLEAPIEKAIEEAEAAEKAQALLTGALVATGQYSEATSEAVAHYAEQVAHATGTNEEMVKSHIAMAIQLGLTVAQAEQMEQASRKLAVVTGGDENHAFMLLQQSLQGHARGLSRSVQGVTDLTAAQLRSGQAIALVNQQLTAAYDLYQGSFAVSVQRATTSINELYRNFGEIITQNPAVRAAINEFALVMQQASGWIEKNKTTMGQWLTEGVLAMVDGLGALNSIFDAVSRVGTIAFQGVYGAVNALSLGIVTLIDGPFALLYKGLSLLPGVGKDFGARADEIINHAAEIAAKVNASAAAIDNALNNQTGASATLENGILKVRDAVVQATAADAAHKKAIEDKNDSMSAANAIIQKQVQLYGDYEIGNAKIRQTLAGQKSDQDKALKDFQDYYNARVQVATTASEKEAIQEANIAKYKADLLKGTGGASERDAGTDAAIKAETVKRDQLKKMYQEELIDQEEYQDAALASVRREKELEMQAELDAAKAEADALKGTGGSTEASAAAQQAIAAENLKQEQLRTAYAKEEIDQKQFDAAMLASQQKVEQEELKDSQAHNTAMLALQVKSDQAFQAHQKQMQTQQALAQKQRLAQAKQEGATDAQLKTMEAEINKENLAKMNQDEAAYYQQKAQMEDAAGNHFQAFLDNMTAAQAKEGAVLGTLHSVQQSQYYQQEMTMLNNLSSLRNSHSKAAFELGKKAAIAQATIQTFMSATEAYASLASIPIVGPVLGAAAAAAAIAAGFVQIQNINAQNMAHGGLDAVPAGMDNSTFLLSAGERVIQPEANKDLTAFLAKQNTPGQSGTQGGGNTYSVSLTYNASGNGSQADAKDMVDIVVKQLRKMSERGVPIISSKGVVNS